MQKVQYIAEKMLNKALSKIRASSSRYGVEVEIKIYDAKGNAFITMQSRTDTKMYCIDEAVITQILQNMQIQKEDSRNKTEIKISTIDEDGQIFPLLSMDPR